MITEDEYLHAIFIVLKYEQQQKTDIENERNGNLNLLKVLSERSKNAIINHNKRLSTENKDKITYISDVVELILNTKNVHAILKLRGIGKVSYYEIMSYVYPLLKIEVENRKHKDNHPKVSGNPKPV